jgi:cytochrome c-type biogenesis protein CcmE
MSKGVQIAIATLSVFAALGWMIASSEGSFQYFASVSELTPADRARSDGLRIHGFVVEGSISREVSAGYIDFAVRDRIPESGGIQEAAASGSSSVAVHYGDIDVPDLFRDGAEVVVEGGFTDGRFVARKIMAKCPSKYEVAPAVPDQET